MLPALHSLPSLGGPPVLLTVEEAARVPPADRMGKAAAYERMIWLRGWLGRSEEHGLIDVTHCADFAWQTWLANVHHQAAFIGPGICSVFVTPPEKPEVQLWAHRCDGTWAGLQLDRTWQGQGWHHAVRFLGVHQLPGGRRVESAGGSSSAAQPGVMSTKTERNTLSMRCSHSQS